MTRSLRIALWVALGAAAASLQAQTAFTTRPSNLRAGPDRSYPVVALLPPDTEVAVAGCVADWSWCDVIVGPDRGWVYAGSLVYPYENRRVTILSRGGWVGLPIVVFSPGIYWDTYYRGRPWYGRRSYWVGRPAPVFRSHSGRPLGVRPQVIREPVRGHAVRPEVRRAPPPPARAPVARPERVRVKPPPPRPVVKVKEKPH